MASSKATEVRDRAEEILLALENRAVERWRAERGFLLFLRHLLVESRCSALDTPNDNTLGGRQHLERLVDHVKTHRIFLRPFKNGETGREPQEERFDLRDLHKALVGRAKGVTKRLFAGPVARFKTSLGPHRPKKRWGQKTDAVDLSPGVGFDHFYQDVRPGS